MGLLEKIFGREASVKQLSSQLEAARNALAEAGDAVSSAQEAFDDAGSDATAKALAKARDVERLAGEHVARAERLLEAARVRDEKARVAALESERNELIEKLNPVAVDGQFAPLGKREVDLLEQVAEVRKQMRDEARLNLGHQARLREIARELGEADPPEVGLLWPVGGGGRAAWFEVHRRVGASSSQAARWLVSQLPDDSSPYEPAEDFVMTRLRESFTEHKK